MSQLFEYIDSLTSPYEAFWVDSRNINDPTRPHWHYYIEVIYVEIGELYVECEEHRRTLSPGDCAIFHSRMIHTMTPVDRDNYRYGVIKFDISRLQSGASFTPRLRTVVEAARKSSSASLFFSAGSLDRNLVSRVFNTCVRECDDKRYGSDLVVHSNLCELMVALARFWRAEGLDIAGSVSTGYTGGIESVTEYIDEHSAEPLSVEGLAKRCGMSYSYFAKNFRQMYGRSCKEYIEFVRVSKAEDLLLFTDFDLTYISLETGFADCSHLIKVFRKWKGITPKQYKLLHSRT
ncbi:MAG: AraC family transcriptional regulator [Lachnospiraceae bacterium]|nr:AraC family transcriptional regulator [Lachnospiraceae bacterium]